MATSRLCSISGCDKRHYGHGFCEAHYTRWRRHGDPTAGRTPEGEPSTFYREVVLAHEDNSCLLWPYSRSEKGYGLMWVGGKLCSVHRLVCEHVNGNPPSEEFEAAHSCGNGHLGCVSKHHLSWKTPTANAADKLQHGTHIRGEQIGIAKLIEEDVRAIRALQGSLTHAAIAERFGVSPSLVGYIYSGKAWGWLE